MKQKWLLFGLVIIALILQSTVLELVRFYVKPDLVLILVVFFALLQGTRQGFLLGLAVGLLEDLLIGRYLGLHSLTMALTAGTVGLLEDKVFKENLLVPVIVVFGATLLRGGLLLGVTLLAGVRVVSLKTGIGLAFMEACYNALLVPIFYRCFFSCYRRFNLQAESGE